MKKIKLLILIGLILISTGCFKRDNMEDINIITTVYPLEYVIDKLYGDNSIVNSIYPDGINIKEYEITKKQVKDYSKKELFVYNGLTGDKDIALTLLNKNKNILIIDANYGMNLKYGSEELWLNPSNLLMTSQNIKNSLFELIENKYLKEEINNSYDDLKVELSELDASIKLTVEKSGNKTILVGSKSLLFLSKYGLNVIYISDEAEREKDSSTANELLANGNEKNIFILENDTENTMVQKLKKESNATIVTFDRLDNISDEERDNKEDYITLMNKNIEVLKKGL